MGEQLKASTFACLAFRNPNKLVLLKCSVTSSQIQKQKKKEIMKGIYMHIKEGVKH